MQCHGVSGCSIRVQGSGSVAHRWGRLTVSLAFLAVLRLGDRRFWEKVLQAPRY